MQLEPDTSQVQSLAHPEIRDRAVSESPLVDRPRTSGFHPLVQAVQRQLDGVFVIPKGGDQIQDLMAGDQPQRVDSVGARLRVATPFVECGKAATPHHGFLNLALECVVYLRR